MRYDGRYWSVIWTLYSIYKNGWPRHNWYLYANVSFVSSAYHHNSPIHDDVIKWKRGALMFSLICSRINGWVNNREACDLIRHGGHYDVIVIISYRPYHSKQPGLCLCHASLCKSHGCGAIDYLSADKTRNMAAINTPHRIQGIGWK